VGGQRGLEPGGLTRGPRAGRTTPGVGPFEGGGGLRQGYLGEAPLEIKTRGMTWAPPRTGEKKRRGRREERKGKSGRSDAMQMW